VLAIPSGGALSGPGSDAQRVLGPVLESALVSELVRSYEATLGQMINARILDSASLPQAPLSTGQLWWVLFGYIGSVAVPALVLAARFHWRGSLDFPADVPARLARPCAGSLPLTPAINVAEFLADRPFAQALAEGKSTLAATLALTLAFGASSADQCRSAQQRGIHGSARPRTQPDDLPSTLMVPEVSLSLLLSGEVRRQFPRVLRAERSETLFDARQSAVRNRIDFVIFPRILLWEDTVGTWCELADTLRHRTGQELQDDFGLDRARIQLTVLDITTGRVVDVVAIDTRAGLLGLYRDAPDRLLVAALCRYVDSLVP
jgi:hypothetical protein